MLCAACDSHTRQSAERPMWPTIHRARRRITGGASEPAEMPPAAPLPAPERVTVDEVLVLGGPQFDRLGKALRVVLGPEVERLDTPARIERALSMFISGRDGVGRPHVLRRPAGLSAPQAWEIHLDGVHLETSQAVRDASRTGRFQR